MKKNWKEEKIKELFEIVEEHKSNNKPVMSAFKIFAQKNGRKVNSVRNFYYQEVENLKVNRELSEKLKINLNRHEKNNFAKFDERQTQKLLDFVKNKQKEGKSVRNACLELANNDARLMVRYQNKYRAISKNENSGVISFPVQQKLLPHKLTDEEIKSLFLGLVKLVKKSAMSEVDEKMRRETEFANDALRKTLVEVTKKRGKISQLQNENRKLNLQISALKQKLLELRTISLENSNNASTQ